MFWVITSLLLIAGFLFGYKLSLIPNLNTSKVLNIIGLLYSLVGVLVLSEMLSSSIGWKKISVEILAPAILYLHSVIPFGAFVGASLLGSMKNCPSAKAVSRFSMGFLAYSILPLMLVDETIVYPRSWPHKDISTRFRLFGLYLVLTGIGLQIIAAIADLSAR